MKIVRNCNTSITHTHHYCPSKLSFASFLSFPRLPCWDGEERDGKRGEDAGGGGDNACRMRDVLRSWVWYHCIVAKARLLHWIFTFCAPSLLSSSLLTTALTLAVARCCSLPVAADAARGVERCHVSCASVSEHADPTVCRASLARRCLRSRPLQPAPSALPCPPPAGRTRPRWCAAPSSSWT